MRVGTRLFADARGLLLRDHPHACGDKKGTAAVPGWSSGIIPMRVGTSYEKAPNESGLWDHPHACGDKFNFHLLHLLLAGSSPCVWGQVLTNGGYTHLWRIIPMRVGTSQIAKVCASFFKDHPHACGDKFDEQSGELESRGIIPMRVGTSVHIFLMTLRQ